MDEHLWESPLAPALPKDGNEVVPNVMFAVRDETFHEHDKLALGDCPLDEGLAGIWIKPPIVLRIAMHNAVRRCVDVNVPALLRRSAHLEKRHPKAGIVLEYGAGHDQIKRSVLDR